MTAATVQRKLREFASPRRANMARRYFKPGLGGYGEGDKFIGVSLPNLRRVAHDYLLLSRTELRELLHSRIHDERCLALIILTEQFARAGEHDREAIYNLYLLNTKYINNWDLVDISATKIVGEYHYALIRTNKGIVSDVFLRLARSKNIWERRIAMLATFAFIKRKEATQALAIADILRHDTHHLIHKAVGWMLREVGKNCSMATLERYLKPRYKRMPRTMLRYAIERLPSRRRAQYLEGKV